MPDAAADIRAALAALDHALAHGDMAAVLDLCADDVLFIGSGEGEEAVGREAIPAMLARVAEQAQGVEFDLTWDTVDVDVRGDVAIVTAWGTARLQTPQRVATPRYRLTGLLVRSGGRWRWRVYHGSEPAPW